MRLEILLTHPAVQALGRALLHFLWQGSLLALLLWIVKAIAPASARVRYAAAGLIMILMPVALVVTVARDLRQPQPIVSLAPMVSSHAQAPAETSREVLLAALPTRGPTAGISGWVVCVWIAGVLLLSLRAAGGWMRAQRLKRRVLAASGELQDMMTRLKHRLGISAPVRFYTSAIVQVPTVIGWLRPYVLLPVTAITGLSESQLEAILAHELAHIRRHDYLVNLLQTAIETVLFYHPAVWWVGKQMRIEREHCCDDIAVAVCGDAIEYAGALAELEQIRGSIPEPALAATGGELLGRIRRLLGQQPSEDSAFRSLGTIAAAAAALMLFIVGARSQPPARPEFDVVSIKPSPFTSSGAVAIGAQSNPGTVTLTGIKPKDLIAQAYSLKSYQIAGPAWLDEEHYNIVAKSAQPVPDSEQRLMLQSMLASRFELTAHMETKELPCYELVIRKGGLKIHPVVADDALPPRYFPNGATAIRGKAISMTRLADLLTAKTDRPVLDRTGVSGVFDIDLKWAPDSDTESGPSLFTAVQEQLGLKLESAKSPVDVLVIDHVEKPTEN